MRALDAAHAWSLRQPLLRVATIGVRVLLALAFVPSGLVKILGQPFTSLPPSDPVGYFFAGFFSAHEYYRVVGVAQWTAAALLIFPRTATAGAALYLPIVANIAAIKVSFGPAFGGTRVVTSAMLLANLYLLAWDWDRWRALLPGGGDDTRHGSGLTAALLLAGAGLAFFGVTSAHVARLGGASVARAALPVVAGVGLALLGLVMAYRRARVDLGAPTAGPLTSREASRYP
jgi:hypothetical protein